MSQPPEPHRICRWCGQTIGAIALSATGHLEWVKVRGPGQGWSSTCPAHPRPRYNGADHLPWLGDSSRPGYGTPRGEDPE